MELRFFSQQRLVFENITFKRAVSLLTEPWQNGGSGPISDSETMDNLLASSRYFSAAI